MPRKRSWSCGGKQRYRSKNEALRALHAIARSPRDQAPVRAYFHDVCKGWHLTSQR